MPTVVAEEAHPAWMLQEVIEDGLKQLGRDRVIEIIRKNVCFRDGRTSQGIDRVIVVLPQGTTERDFFWLRDAIDEGLQFHGFYDYIAIRSR